MKSALTKESIGRLYDLLDRKKTLIAFDFDGTLAPIVEDYREAWMTGATSARLKRLAKREDVAIISGRGLADLRRRVGGAKVVLIGNHGVEAAGADRAKMRSARRACTAWMKQLGERLREHPIPGVRLEPKTYSISVHYRDAKKGARSKLEPLLEELRPRARIVPGKELFNVVTPSAPHKGTALLRLMNRKGWNHAVFVGDDWTDEDVFRMKSKRFFTVRIGRHRSSKAALVLPRQADIDRFLDVLLSHDGASPRARR